MPGKRKWSVWDNPKRAATYLVWIDKTYDSHAGCQYDSLKDYHGGFENSYTEAQASGTVIDWNAWIEYQNSNFRCFNPCKHVVKRISRTGGGQVFLSRSLDFDYVEECHNHEGEYDDVHDRGYARIVLKPILADWQTVFNVGKLESFEYLDGSDLAGKLQVLDRIALDTMIPQLDAGIDIPVFVGEALEIGTLWKQFKHAAGLLDPRDGGMFKHILADLKNFKDAPLKELSKSWLAYTFGWSPFVRDVKKIAEGLWHMFENIDQYADGANERMTLHFEKNLNPLTFKDQSWFDRPNSTVTFDASDSNDEWYFAHPAFKRIVLGTKHEREVSPPEFHATLDFMYNIPALRDGRNYWLDWIGLCLKYWRIKKFSPAQAWELIPFSFVVDWFMSVGPWLEQFDEDWLDIQIVIFDYCHSISYSQRDSVSIRSIESLYEASSYTDSAALWACLPQSTTQHQNVECYWREPLHGGPLPGPDQVINGKTPRGLQWLSAGALLRVLGSRRRR